VGGQIVHDDNVAGRQRGSQAALEVGAEDPPVHRPSMTKDAVPYREIRERLAEHRIEAAVSSIWRFYGIGRPRSSTSLTPKSWSSSTRLARPPIWPARAGDAGAVPRLIGRVPHGHWKTTTLVAGLRIEPFPLRDCVSEPSSGRLPATA
jgi:hypothetical protein